MTVLDIAVLLTLMSGLSCAQLTCHVVPPRAGYATSSIQAAVESCSRSNGTVHFSPGRYLSASIVVSGTVSLYIPAGAVLLAGTQREDYPGDQDSWYLLHFLNCTNCKLWGGGVLDGQGRAWVTGAIPGDRKLVRNFEGCRVAEECRPRLLGIVDSSGVEVSGISLRDSIYWSLHVLCSSGVVVRGVHIESDWDIANTDGIDIDSSKDVEVSGCHIATADDAICLKTTVGSRPTERVAVSNSTLKSRSSAVKLGSESRGAFRHITFSNLWVLDSHRGLAIQLRDEGSVENLTFSDITISTRYYNSTWWGGAEPIYVTASPRTAGTTVGSVRGIRFSGITAAAENGIFVAGAEGHPVVELSISGVKLQMTKRSSWRGGCCDYRPGVRGLECCGTTRPLWLERAQHVLLTNVTVTYHEPLREDWELEPHIDHGSVSHVEFEGCRICRENSSACSPCQSLLQGSTGIVSTGQCLGVERLM